MWHKYISEFLSDLLIILVLLVVLTIGKGAYDLITSGQLHFWRYTTSLIYELFGSAIFFGIMELVSMLWNHRKSK